MISPKKTDLVLKRHTLDIYIYIYSSSTEILSAPLSYFCVYLRGSTSRQRGLEHRLSLPRLPANREVKTENEFAGETNESLRKTSAVSDLGPAQAMV